VSLTTFSTCKELAEYVFASIGARPIAGKRRHGRKRSPSRPGRELAELAAGPVLDATPMQRG
jgi:hypothetical protein